MGARGGITSTAGGIPTIGGGDEAIGVELKLGNGTNMDGDKDSRASGGVAAGAAGLVNNSIGRRMNELKELEDEGIRMIMFVYVNRVST